jgi:hypothetical protein
VTPRHDPAGNEPEAVIERHGRWWHLVYIRHGLMRGGPGGHGWRVFGERRAERKARKVLADYVKQLNPPEAKIIRADDLGSSEG